MHVHPALRRDTQARWQHTQHRKRIIMKAICTYQLPESSKQQPDWNHVKKPLEFRVLERNAAHVWTHGNYLCPFSSLSWHHSHTAQTPSDPFMKQQQRARRALHWDSQSWILMLLHTHTYTHTYTHTLTHTLTCSQMEGSSSAERSVVRECDHLCAWALKAQSGQRAQVQDQLGQNTVEQ